MEGGVERVGGTGRARGDNSEVDTRGKRTGGKKVLQVVKLSTVNIRDLHEVHSVVASLSDKEDNMDTDHDRASHCMLWSKASCFMTM